MTFGFAVVVVSTENMGLWDWLAYNGFWVRQGGKSGFFTPFLSLLIAETCQIINCFSLS